jgi:hypothetical protein
MSDLAHQWGSDLEFGPTGDLAVLGGSALGQQRVLRRLLTSPLDYIWQRWLSQFHRTTRECITNPRNYSQPDIQGGHRGADSGAGH